MTKTVISCILGHRYGRRLITAISDSSELAGGEVELSHVFCLHPSYAYSAGGYESAVGVLKQNRISYSFFQHVDSQDVHAKMASIAPRYVFVCGLRQIVPISLLRLVNGADWDGRISAPSFGFIAFHPSDLPDGAGLSPVQWTILEGATEIAVSAFFCDDIELDGGDIITKGRFQIGNDVDAAQLDRLIGDQIGTLAKRILPDIVRHNVKAVAQSQTEMARRFRGQMRPIDRWLDFESDARLLSIKVRAFTRPYGGAVFTLGDRIGLVYKATAIDIEGQSQHPGTVLLSEPFIVVQCRGGALRLEDIEWLSGEDDCAGVSR